MVLLTTRARQAYTDFAWRPDDLLMVGRESAGVPQEVYAAAEASVHIPMRRDLRSLNVAMAAAMVVGEALRRDDALGGRVGRDVGVVRPGQQIALPMARHRPIFNRRRSLTD